MENGFDNVLVVVWSIYRGHAPQRSSFPYPRLFFGDFLITFTRILLQFIGHIILCPLTINPANIIANVSVNNSRTGSASEIIMFNAQLNPNANYVATINALENLFEHLSDVQKGSILEPMADYLWSANRVNHNIRIVTSYGIWAMLVQCRSTGISNLYLGRGYQDGILSGNKSLTEWRDGYVIANVQPATVDMFRKTSVTHYGFLADLLTHYNSGEDWGTCSPEFSEFELPYGG